MSAPIFPELELDHRSACHPPVPYPSPSKMAEKLPQPISTVPTPRPHRNFLSRVLIFSLLVNLALLLPSYSSPWETIKSFPLWNGAGPCSGHRDSSPTYEAEFLAKHSKCPKQPKAIYPNLTWEMTPEEKRLSINKYSQAVVRISNSSPDFIGGMHVKHE